jgi:hypothetical protein
MCCDGRQQLCGNIADYEWLKSNHGNKWEGKIYHTKALVQERFPEEAKHVRFNFAKHAPHPMSLQLLKEMADIWPIEYNLTSHSRFRTYDTVDITVLYQSYCQVDVPRGVENTSCGISFRVLLWFTDSRQVYH